MGTPDASVIVLAAHGSRAAEANEAHRDVAIRVAAATGQTVLPAFLELAEPGIGQAIDQAIDQGALDVVVVPYFLHPGRHLLSDIPAIVADAGTRHPNRTIRMSEHLGASDQMVGIVVDLVNRAG